MRTTGFRWAAFFSCCLLTCSLALGQAFPAKPIKLVLPFAPGGAMDAVARPISEAFQKATGQPLVIENVGGAGGLVGAAQVVRAPPDGYSLLMASNGQISIAPYLNIPLPYNPQTSLLPIINIATNPVILYAGGKTSFRSLQDVVSEAKRRPCEITFAHPGSASLGHLSLKLFAQQAGVRFNNIGYKGAGPALVDVASGEVQLVFTHISTAQPYVSSGRVRPIAVASERRLAQLPDVPTFAEAGLPGVNVSLWVGLMAPAGTSTANIATIARSIDESLRTPEMKSRLEAQGFEIQGGTPRDFSEFITEDRERWRKLAATVDMNAN